MAEDTVLSIDGIARHFELDPRETALIRKRLQGKDVGRVGQFKLFRLSDAEAAVQAAAAAAARRAAAAAKRAEQVSEMEPCGRCGRPIPSIWILDRCHQCMQEAA